MRDPLFAQYKMTTATGIAGPVSVLNGGPHYDVVPISRLGWDPHEKPLDMPDANGKPSVSVVLSHVAPMVPPFEHWEECRSQSKEE